jgi:hypothetical protein
VNAAGSAWRHRSHRETRHRWPGGAIKRANSENPVGKKPNTPHAAEDYTLYILRDSLGKTDAFITVAEELIERTEQGKTPTTLIGKNGEARAPDRGHIDTGAAVVRHRTSRLHRCTEENPADRHLADALGIGPADTAGALDG